MGNTETKNRKREEVFFAFFIIIKLQIPTGIAAAIFSFGNA